MPNNEKVPTIEIARQFVELALKYKSWHATNPFLSTEEVLVLDSIVETAGFEFGEIKFGEAWMKDSDMGGEMPGIAINTRCPYMVTNEDGKAHEFATGWLDRLLNRVVRHVKREDEKPDQIIYIVASEIERSIPLEPIQLTLEDDFLCEFPPETTERGENLIDHVRDEDFCRRSKFAGMHECCKGEIILRDVNRKYDVLRCTSCEMRVIISKGVRTYGELRTAMETSLLIKRNQRFPGRGEIRFK